MLPRSRRLTKQADIVRTMQQGQVIATPYVRIHLIAQHPPAASRVACIVGKKVHPLATRRHTYQRWLRVAARSAMERLNQPYDMVWVAQSGIAELGGSRALYGKLEPYLLTHFT